MRANDELVQSAIKAFEEAERLALNKETDSYVGAYEKASRMLKTIWEEKREMTYGLKLMKALRKSRHYEEALMVSREVFKLYGDRDAVKNSYAWVIYDYKIRVRNESITNEKEFFKAANAICEMTAAGIYSPYTATVMKVLDYLKKKTNRIDLEEKWLNKVQPGDLSTEVRNISDNGKNISVPSDKEKWFSLKASVLFEKKEYMECIKFCDKALEELQVYSKNNEGGFFFVRKRAQAKLSIPQLEESGLRELEGLLSRRPEWYIFSDLASHHLSKGLVDDAYKYSLFSLIYYPNKAKFVTVKTPLEILGKIFDLREERELSAKHYALIIHAFKVEEYKISPEYTSKANVDGESLVEKYPIKKLSEELQSLWIDEIRRYLDKVLARVTKVLPDRKKVFVKSENGSEYSFKFANFQGRARDLSSEDRVTLYINQITSKKNGAKEAIIAEKDPSS